MRAIYRLKTIVALVGLTRDPLKTDLVFTLSDNGKDSNPHLITEADEKLARIKGANALFAEDYDPGLPAIDQLSALPQNSFGNAFASFIKKNSLDVGFFPKVKSADRIDYFINRSRYSHDQWHVLTGFEATIPGEIGLQAFTLAQLKSPVSAALIAVVLLHVVLFNHALFDEAVEALFKGYEMGRRSEPLFGIKLEQYWTEDLGLVRRELKIA